MKKLLFLVFLFLPMKAGAVNFTIVLSTTDVVRCAVAYSYSATLPDGSANPETVVQFVGRMFKATLKNAILALETGLGVTSAQTTAQNNQLNIP